MENEIVLFGRDQAVISRHINNSFAEEVEKESNMHFLHIANSDIMTTLVMNLLKI